jgi:hypothetical protein
VCAREKLNIATLGWRRNVRIGASSIAPIHYQIREYNRNQSVTAYIFWELARSLSNPLSCLQRLQLPPKNSSGGAMRGAETHATKL